MKRNVALWEFLLGLATALVACFFFFTKSAAEDGKFKENIELRMQLAEKNISELIKGREKQDEKLDKMMGAQDAQNILLNKMSEQVTGIRLDLKDKADRAK